MGRNRRDFLSSLGFGRREQKDATERARYAHVFHQLAHEHLQHSRDATVLQQVATSPEEQQKHSDNATHHLKKFTEHSANYEKLTGTPLVDYDTNSCSHCGEKFGD